MSVVQSICNKVAMMSHEIVERGKVSIFANQKSEAAKINSEDGEAIVASRSSETIEVLFNEFRDTHAPLITSLAAR